MSRSPNERRRATVADFYAIPEEERRHELIDGEIVDMSGGTYAHSVISLNLGAEVRAALIGKGYPRPELPSERTMRDILNRMNYRLKRLRKGVPLKKTEQTDAIFANVQAVREEVRDDPATLEISMDTKAKVALGDYVRGGKNADRLRR